MRRTLTVAALAAAMLVPAVAASADPGSSVGTNASCSNGKGGNHHGTYNHLGNVAKAAEKCAPVVTDLPGDDTPVDELPIDWG